MEINEASPKFQDLSISPMHSINNSSLSCMKNNQIMKVSIKLFLIFFIIFGMSSCAAMEPITPNNYNLLLIKTNDLFNLCIMLLNQPEQYHGQIVSRLYYGYYHLARLLHINYHNYDAGGHAKTWNKLPCKIRIFGLRMKILREKHDYNVINNLTENIDKDFDTILDEEKNFVSLSEELGNTLEKCTYLSDKDIEICRNKINDIRITHETLINRMKQKKK